MKGEYNCQRCERSFESKRARGKHILAKHSNEIMFSPKQKRRIAIWSFFLVILVGAVWFFSSVEFQEVSSGSLPPTDMVGHIEVNPPSQVLKRPMDLAIQKHMLEHANGIEGGRGGVVINYECRKFECEADLVGKLESFAAKYYYVYVAPYYGMNTKIALTKLGKIKTLEEYDEYVITSFVES